MRLPRWTRVLLRWCAPPGRADDLLGDLEEVHRERVDRMGRFRAALLTWAEALGTAATLAVAKWRGDFAEPAAARPSDRPGRAPWVSLLDVKLGVRMLVKYPGLTVVGALAMAFGIWVGACGFELYTQVIHPRIPLDEGDRIVGIRQWDASTGRAESRVLLDFAAWRGELTSVVELGAFRPMSQNLVVAGERGEPIEAAAITASAFALARVAPHLGRTLVPADERADAGAVVVLGYDVWLTRLAGDPDVVGRTVRLGDEPTTVVGVMPPGFMFPVNYGLWVPMRADPASFEPRQGPVVAVFGRLAPGATLERAQAELDAYASRSAQERPDVYEHLRPEVRPYAASILDLPRPMWVALGSINLGLVLLLAIMCSNVALLLFARAAAREGEILVRTALGASRARVIGQLFAEALALGAVAAVVGLGAAGFGIRWMFGIVREQFIGGAPLPFWFHPTLSPSTVLYAVGLTVLGAAIAGVVPGLKVTGGKVDARLRRTTAGGGGLRFGGVWTGVIVLQVALTVTFPVVAWAVRRDAENIRALEVGFASERFLAARVRVERTPPGAEEEDASGYASRFGATTRELIERLESEPEVAGVTLAGSLPATYHPWRRIEVDEGGEAPRNAIDEGGPGRWIAGGFVSPDFFEVLDAEILRGRGFHQGDTDPEAQVVVVNRSFAENVLGGRNPIGRHVRYLGSDDAWDGVRLGDPPGPWHRIVGVVEDLGMTDGSTTILGAGIYHAVQPESLRASWLILHVNGDPLAFATRLREVAAAVDPTLGLEGLLPLDQAKASNLRFYAFWFWLVVGVSTVALLLSLAGIYAVMSFTVAQRTREIGVRVALGARPSAVAAAIFRRPAIQTGAGLLIGFALTAWFASKMSADAFLGTPALLVLAYSLLMTAICLLACVVPTRRALSIEPTEALRADG